MRASLVFVLSLANSFACGDRSKQAKPAATEPGPAAAASRDAHAKYASLMEGLGRRTEEALAAWTATELETQAEAAEAMFQLTPAGARGKELMQAALGEVGLTAEELADYVVANPLVVDGQAKLFEERLDAAMAKHQERVAEIEKLPAGDMEGAQSRMAAMLEQSRTSSAPRAQSAPLAGWTAVTSLAELKVEVGEAVSQRKPVIIHFRAKWAMPTLRLEGPVQSEAAMKDAECATG